MKALLIVLILLFPIVVAAGNGSNIQVLNGNDRGATVTPEYFWKTDVCGGLSFIDLYESSQFFTNSVIDCSIGDSIFLGAEVSANNNGETLKVGIGRAFTFSGIKVLRITAYPGVWSGFGDEPQVKLVWLTEDWELTDTVSLYSTGFYRFRRDIPDAYQPQVWLKKEGWKTHVGIEVFGVGRKRDVQLALKFVF
jgi:hypothetical protein